MRHVTFRLLFRLLKYALQHLLSGLTEGQKSLAAEKKSLGTFSKSLETFLKSLAGDFSPLLTPQKNDEKNHTAPPFFQKNIPPCISFRFFVVSLLIIGYNEDNNVFFRDVIGQAEAKERLLALVAENRIPHALLFTGKEGTGKIPLALAFAQYLCCEHPSGGDACGQCPSCVKMNHYAHPDVHYVFPVIKRKNMREAPVSDDFMKDWRDMLTGNPYFSMHDWLQRMKAENQQALIYTRESDEIQRKLALKSSQGGYKILIVWLPEKMNAECANKLLKILEEPPQQTLFLLVTEAADALLSTVISRTQIFHLPPIPENELADMLCRRYSIQPDDAAGIAHRSEGSALRAIENIHIDEENQLYFDFFVRMMRLAYARQVKGMKDWSEELTVLGRERQKNFLAYCQRMIRENFIYRLREPSMLYLGKEENQFASRFSPFVSEKNVIGIMEELALAEKHIEQNVNARFVFFDLALKMIVLLLKYK